MPTMLPSRGPPRHGAISRYGVRAAPRPGAAVAILGQRQLRSVPVMATFALIHGGGGSAWDWHLVVPELHKRGHVATAVDLPTEDSSAGWWVYAQAVVDAVREQRRPLIVVGHSLGGFTAPLVCARIPVALLVLVAAMIPSAGERFDEWWTNAGYADSGLDDVFYHDVQPELAAEAQRRERQEEAMALREPWPLHAWPQTPTRY